MSAHRVVFVVAPPGPHNRYTEQAVAGMVGQTTTVGRLDGSRTPARVSAAELTSDGMARLTLDVPGGIDRGPR